jgi:hypothetical protein
MLVFLVGTSVGSWGWSICGSWGRSIGRLDLSWEDSFTLVLDISNISVLISRVGHNLDAGIGKDNTVRSTGLVSVTALRVSKVVGVRVTDSVLKVVLGRNISIDLSWSIGGLRSISRGRCWSISWCRGVDWFWSWSVGALVLGPGNCNCTDSRQDNNLKWKKHNFQSLL